MKRIVVKSSKKYTIIIDKGILSENMKRSPAGIKKAVLYI
jgi:hypothetical protein